jgi:hypothetical protein
MNSEILKKGFLNIFEKYFNSYKNFEKLQLKSREISNEEN